MLSRWKWRVTH
jgi:hypothetical protein